MGGMTAILEVVLSRSGGGFGCGGSGREEERRESSVSSEKDASPDCRPPIFLSSQILPLSQLPTSPNLIPLDTPYDSQRGADVPPSPHPTIQQPTPAEFLQANEATFSFAART